MKCDNWAHIDITRVMVSLMECHGQWRPQDLREGGAKTFAREARAQNFSHAPKTLTTPLIKRVLEGSWLTKKAVLGQIATRNCSFGSEFRGQ